MPIDDQNDNNFKQNAAPQQPTTLANAMNNAHTNQRQQEQPHQAKGGFSFRTMGNLSRNVMGRTPASEVLSKLYKALNDVYTEAGDKAFEITLIPVDLNTTTELSVSILIVCLREHGSPDNVVAFHTLIVEGSIEVPIPRFEMINGVNTEIIRTAGDANDNILRAVVRKHVSNKFPQSNQIFADACVVPRDFNVADTNAVYSLAANALFATSSEMETHRPGFVDLNLGNADNDSNLTIRTTFGNAQIHNAVGQPLRSDIQIDFSAAPTNAAQNQQQVVERVSNIARVSGFMDLMWFPVENNQNNYYVQQPNSYQRYAARFVVTALESSQLLTIPAQLLALIPALSLSEGNKWVQAFRRQNFSNKIDMHDIGAVGIEVNFENNANGIGTRINTSADSFKPEQYHKLISSVVRQGMILSLDIPECGPDTWYNNIFGLAANGDQDANQTIIDAANILTNYAFAKYFPVGGRIATDESNRIHLGHYSDDSGVRKDIRDIDYLAVMNLVGEKDPQVIKDWSDSFLKTNYPIELRLAGRKRIISAMVNDAVFTGFAARVTFTPEFTSALSNGCKEAGLNMRTIDSYADMGNFERAIGSFAGASLLSGDTSGIFNRGYGGMNQQFGHTASRFINRWNT